ncbi:MAG: PrsW family intramembrane metalloprotease [Bacteroidales bacterium]|nr:PrsW family intramembrane metalloprotease [Bacteroidales bacterium]MCF8328196.1 PrsW family intramembrane metalloprotease [Bacteroidales bacterium]
MSWSIVSIFISFLLGIFAVRYLQRFDIYAREPLWAMAFTVGFGGGAAVILSLGLYELFTPIIPNNFLNTFTGALLVIGPIEEFAKLAGLLISWPFIRKQVSEINDSIIYIACVALGFSLIENYMYANRMAGEEYLLFMRLFISTPMHIAFSVFMGYAFYRVKFEKKSWKMLGAAFIWSVALHGAFDGFLFMGQPVLVFILVFVSIQQVLSMANFTNYLSPYKLKFQDIASQYTLDQVVQKPCPYCQTTTANDVIKFKNIRLFFCHQCNHYHGNQQNITRLLDYLHPHFRLSKSPRELNIVTKNGKRTYTYKDTIYFTDSTLKQAYFRMEDIQGLTIRMKTEAKRKFKNNLYYPARYFVE